MKLAKLVVLSAAAVLLAGLAQSPAQANEIVNPGFEDPITYDGPPFVGFWEGFTGGGATASNASLMPRSGAQHLLLQVDPGFANTFTGVFQDVAGLSAGEEGVFSGWHKTASDPTNQSIEIRIEWRDSANDVEISRTPNLTPTLTDAYQEFSVTATVPDGADTARLTYAIESFSVVPVDEVLVYVDDTSFLVDGTVATESATWGNLKSLYR